MSLLEPTQAERDVTGLLDMARTNAQSALDPDFIADAARLLVDHALEYEVLASGMRAIKVVRIREWEKLVKSAGRELCVARAQRKRNDAELGVGPGNWRERLILTEKFTPKPSTANVVTMLTYHPEWAGCFRFNEFTNGIETTRPPPWHGEVEPVQGDQGAWTEADDIRMVCTIEREMGFSLPPKQVYAAVDMIARRTPHHPVREYLAGLEWDGKKRLGSWLRTYLHATEQSRLYTSKVGGWFLVSMVARIFTPGCQADHMLVLEGPQGHGKSTGVRVLAGEWYGEIGGDGIGSNKDSYLALAGKWVVEFAELDGLSKSDTTRVKRYISAPIDYFRPPYARGAVAISRQCGFIGTTNDSDYLRDHTGNRRFWPVSISGKIDTDALRADRDQLWAEAFRCWRDGVPYWPTEDAKDLESTELKGIIAAEQDARVQVDPWEPPIRDWLGDKTEVKMAELLFYAVGREVEAQTKSDQTRVGHIMTRLGYVRSRPMRDGLREYLYLRSGSQLEIGQ